MLFFGDLPNAWVASVGLNPSKFEYLDRSGRELTGSFRRFETLSSLEAPSRQALTDAQTERARATMLAYFQPGKPAYSWFDHLNRVLGGLGVSYQAGTGAHLDLVQEATDPTWSTLAKDRPGEASDLLRTDLPFLRWEIEAFRIRLLLCNGRTVFDEVIGLLGGHVVKTGILRRVTWWVGTAGVADRTVGLAGWNIPLVRPTGLGSRGESELGAILGTASQAAGVTL